MRQSKGIRNQLLLDGWTYQFMEGRAVIFGQGGGGGGPINTVLIQLILFSGRVRELWWRIRQAVNYVW